MTQTLEEKTSKAKARNKKNDEERPRHDIRFSKEQDKKLQKEADEKHIAFSALVKQKVFPSNESSTQIKSSPEEHELLKKIIQIFIENKIKAKITKEEKELILRLHQEGQN
jgi:hypothetical protein